jgi:hypothetical protein
MQWDADLQWERTRGRGRRKNFFEEQNDAVLLGFFYFFIF